MAESSHPSSGVNGDLLRELRAHGSKVNELPHLIVGACVCRCILCLGEDGICICPDCVHTFMPEETDEACPADRSSVRSVDRCPTTPTTYGRGTAVDAMTGPSTANPSSVPQSIHA